MTTAQGRVGAQSSCSAGKEKNMRAIIKYPGEVTGHYEEIENSLEALQDVVCGYIETIQCGGSSVLIINEEGKLLGLEPNFRIKDFDIIAGTAIVVGVDDEDFTDVPINMAAWKRILTEWGN